MAIDLIPGKKIFTQRDVRETANIAGTPAIADFTSAQHNHASAAAGGAISNINTITTKSHTSLTDIGTNTHAQVDTHIAGSIVTPTTSHGITGFGTEPAAVSSSTSGTAGAATTVSRGDHGHDLSAHLHSGATVGGQLDHTACFSAGTGTNTHAQIDTHIGTATVTSAVAGEGIDVSGATGAVTISCEDATSANKGIALFPAVDFTVTAGSVAINNERICDDVGAMVTGNTETNCTVTYQDADNTLDFVVETATSAVLGVASFNSTDFLVTAGAVTLANKTSYLTIAGCSFQTRVPATDPILIDADNGAFFTVSGTTVSASCSVSIPHGAVVTGVKVTGTGTWNWYLYSDTLLSSGSPTQMATAANGTEDTTITSGTIDNSLYRYWFEVYALGTDETIDSARIKYTTDYD